MLFRSTGSGTLTIGSSATLDVNGTLKTDSLEPRTTAGDIFGLSSGGPLSGGGRVAVGFNSFATNEDVVTMKTGPILHITNPTQNSNLGSAIVFGALSSINGISNQVVNNTATYQSSIQHEKYAGKETLAITSEQLALWANSQIEMYSGTSDINMWAGKLNFNGTQVAFNGDNKHYAFNFKNDYQPDEKELDRNSEAPGVLKLELGSETLSENNNFIGFHQNDTLIGAINGQTDTYLGQSGIKLESAGADYAEYLERLNPKEKINKGDVIGVFGGKITRNTKGADKVMVISSMPVVLGNWKGKKSKELYEPVAFVGQVPVRVIGKVNTSDYIIPSGKQDGIGIAISSDDLTADQLSTIIGQAWESSEKTGVKLINVAITPLDRPSSIIKQLQKENEQLKDDLEDIKDQIKELKKLVLNSKK